MYKYRMCIQYIYIQLYMMMRTAKIHCVLKDILYLVSALDLDQLLLLFGRDEQELMC